MKEKQAIKDFIEMMEWNDFGDEDAIIATPEYTALKALLDQPTSKMEPTRTNESVNISSSGLMELNNTLLDALRSNILYATDTQDNDGWIEHSVLQVPNIAPSTLIEVKLVTGAVYRDQLMKIKTEWWLGGQINQVTYDRMIMKYRIIEEPKEQSYTRANMLAERRAEEENLEPQKQTLVDYVNNFPVSHGWTHEGRVLLEVISAYLEQSK